MFNMLSKNLKSVLVQLLCPYPCFSFLSDYMSRTCWLCWVMLSYN